MLWSHFWLFGPKNPLQSSMSYNLNFSKLLTSARKTSKNSLTSIFCMLLGFNVKILNFNYQIITAAIVNSNCFLFNQIQECFMTDWEIESWGIPLLVSILRSIKIVKNIYLISWCVTEDRHNSLSDSNFQRISALHVVDTSEIVLQNGFQPSAVCNQPHLLGEGKAAFGVVACPQQYAAWYTVILTRWTTAARVGEINSKDFPFERRASFVPRWL